MTADEAPRSGGSPQREPAAPSARGGLLWRVGVPLVCALAGFLLAATHTVSGGNEIRRGDSPAPRLVDLVRETQKSVDKLSATRDGLANQMAAARAQSAGGDSQVAAALAETGEMADAAGVQPVTGPGLVVTLTDAKRDAYGRFPRDASPDDLVVHQQDVEGVLNALWSAGAEAIQMQDDQRLVASSVPRCVGNTLLLHGRTYSPPYVITAIGDADAMQAALDAAPLVTLYRQYVARFGLGYTVTRGHHLEVAGYRDAVGPGRAAPLEGR
ncbi:Probable conserved membrane protein [Mycobacteroides abscessus subsp. bolletii]|nr:Probable conserved membrane protein [Mycobacteroides abscessus subsp. bolletii]